MNPIIVKEDLERAASHLSFFKPLQDANIFISGGTGFVGTWLAELAAYLNDRHGWGMRLFLLSRRISEFIAKAPHLAIRQDITLIERDVRSVFDIPQEVQWVIHLAASPDNREHASDPLKTMQVISGGTQNMLESTTRLPHLKKFLNVSSGLVECVVANASSANAYVEAKRFAETLCAVYRSQHRLPIVNVRPFAFMGPYQKLDRPWAVNNFMRDALLGGPIRILGDGETIRSYMYASDMAVWLFAILANGESGKSYNVGSPHGIHLKDLARKIADQCGPARLEIFSRAEGALKTGASRFVPDLSLCEKELGLRLAVDLDEAICRTMAWNK